METADIKALIVESFKKGGDRDALTKIVALAGNNGNWPELVRYIDAVYTGRNLEEGEKPPNNTSEKILGEKIKVTKTPDDPPIFELRLRGSRCATIHISDRGLFDVKYLHLKILTRWGESFLRYVKKAEWVDELTDYIVAGKLKTRDWTGAELRIRILASVWRCLTQRGEGDTMTDLDSGSYWPTKYRGKNCYAVKWEPIFKWLKRDLYQPVDTDKVEQALRSIGMKNDQVSITVKDTYDNKSGSTKYRPYLWIIPMEPLFNIGELQMMEKKRRKTKHETFPDI